MKSTVAIVHDKDIGRAIDAALDALGDLSGLFTGKHVAVKPNDTWVSDKDLTPCTQADTLRAVVRYIKRSSPWKLTVSGGAGAASTEDVFRLLGLDRVIREEGVEYFDHNHPPFAKVRLDYGPQDEVVVNPRVFEYETLVSLAQLKVHWAATVTLAMKNIAMSFPAADYYGHPRSDELHGHRFFDDMHGFIVGMCKRFPLQLGIVAGHPAMVGQGPIGGQTFESGIVIAGRDPVAVDACGAHLLGMRRVRHIEEAAQQGLGTASLDDIETPLLSPAQAKRLFDEEYRNAYEPARR